MDTSIKRKELVSWLQNVEDNSILLQIEKLREKYSNRKVKQFLTLEEARQLSISKIDKWEEI